MTATGTTSALLRCVANAPARITTAATATSQRRRCVGSTRRVRHSENANVSISATTRPCWVGPVIEARPNGSSGGCGSIVQADRGEDLGAPLEEDVEPRAVLDDRPDRGDAREADHERDERGHLRRPDDRRDEEVEEDVAEQERELLHAQRQLVEVHELVDVDEDAHDRREQEAADGPVQRAAAELRRGPAADEQGGQPHEADPDDHDAVELALEREVDRQARRVERDDPQHHEERREHPRQDPRRVRPHPAVEGRIAVDRLDGGGRRRRRARGLRPRRRAGRRAAQVDDAVAGAHAVPRRLATARRMRSRCSSRQNARTCGSARGRRRAAARPQPAM